MNLLALSDSAAISVAKRWSALCLAAFLSGGVLGAEDPITDSKSEVKRWIEARKTLQCTERDWKVEQETLKQSIQLLEKELEILDREIAKLEAGATEGATRRRELGERQTALTNTAESVSERLKALEERLTRLAAVFPRPLTEKTKPLLRRLWTSGPQTNPSLGQRLQAMLGILNEVDKFNSSLTLTGELRRIDGKQVQVETLYLGLSQAYYVDRSRQRAGVGVPTIDGWEWTPRNELAEAVTHALLVYRNEHPAEFITLPVTLK